MTKDCYGTCPKCGEIGWCHYKGKARIFKSGPGSGTYKVSIFKCGNCGKKFGFELEDDIPEPRLNEEEDYDWERITESLAKAEEDDDWEQITGILAEAHEDLNFSRHSDDFDVSTAMLGIERALDITKKHC